MKVSVPEILAVTLLFAITLPGAVSAKDLGVRSVTWPVAQPVLLAYIKARLVEMQRSGTLAWLEDEARAKPPPATSQRRSCARPSPWTTPCSPALPA